ncbi:hypothetical protein C5Y96_17295 [Blastopirellula marina]|uniref:DUF192 domain-containing protein n=1 Tax=Blastopirellula marina TaxID=124 RepID=A0A2S8F576_9BACT|nr:hypothetical protein C5Y96_17295 [Blastopirellula marina]RCS47836.1 DUF192 domain-containing protein [Bremerella cremea]
MRGVIQLIDAQTDVVLIPRLRLAIHFWSRFRGLQLSPPLAGDEGLLLAPCRSVHTQFMRFAIDIYFCSATGTVLSRKLNAKPWISVAANRNASFAIETPARENPLLEVGQTIFLAGDEIKKLSGHRHLASVIKS